MQAFAEANRLFKHAFIRSKDDDVASGVQNGSNAPKADATNVAVIGVARFGLYHMNAPSPRIVYEAAELSSWMHLSFWALTGTIEPVHYRNLKAAAR